MPRYFAQGDLLIEKLDGDLPVSGVAVATDLDGAIVLARGEVTGHRHAFYGSGVTMFRDDALARDLPSALYLGHIKIAAAEGAELRHEEHDTVKLEQGSYRIRRQREWDAGEARVVAD